MGAQRPWQILTYASGTVSPSAIACFTHLPLHLSKCIQLKQLGLENFTGWAIRDFFELAPVFIFLIIKCMLLLLVVGFSLQPVEFVVLFPAQLKCLLIPVF